MDPLCKADVFKSESGWSASGIPCTFNLLSLILFQVNPNYEGTFVFTNDFQALLEDTPQPGKVKKKKKKSKTTNVLYCMMAFWKDVSILWFSSTITVIMDMLLSFSVEVCLCI